jgi:hypothetical protein
MVRHAPLLKIEFRARDDERARKWRYRTSVVRTAQRAMDGMNSSPHLQLIARPNEDRTIGKAAFPTACFMGEKSGFAKAEAIENE